MKIKESFGEKDDDVIFTLYSSDKYIAYTIGSTFHVYERNGFKRKGQYTLKY